MYFSGKCYVVPKELIPGDPFIWTQKGTYRFYYEKMYNVGKKEFSKLPSNYKEIHGTSLYNAGIKITFKNSFRQKKKQKSLMYLIQLFINYDKMN